MSKDKRETARMIVRLGTTHAHAGQTHHERGLHYRGGNHPCTRGADLGLVPPVCWGMEPPMHTRGRPPRAGTKQPGNGTTHAHAGQTWCGGKIFLHLRNHPCTRGADASEARAQNPPEEPPMHTRGRRLLTRYNVRMSAKLYSVACIMQWMGRRLLIYGDPLR